MGTLITEGKRLASHADVLLAKRVTKPLERLRWRLGSILQTANGGDDHATIHC